MKKEEVLARSKQENLVQDEREKDIRVHRDAFSVIGILIFGFLIMAIKIYHTQSPADIISLLFSMSGFAFLYEGIHLKNKWTAAAGAIFLLLAIYFFYKFCMGVF